jgi:hypothetical protein
MGKPWKRRLHARRIAALRASKEVTVETTPVVLETIAVKTQKPITETVVDPPIKKVLATTETVVDPPIKKVSTTKIVEPVAIVPKKKKSTTKKRSARTKTTKTGTTTSGA